MTEPRPTPALLAAIVAAKSVKPARPTPTVTGTTEGQPSNQWAPVQQQHRSGFGEWPSHDVDLSASPPKTPRSQGQVGLLTPRPDGWKAVAAASLRPGTVVTEPKGAPEIR